MLGQSQGCVRCYVGQGWHTCVAWVGLNAWGWTRDCMQVRADLPGSADQKSRILDTFGKLAYLNQITLIQKLLVHLPG